MRALTLIFIITMFVSCAKEKTGTVEVPKTIFSEATYKATVTLNWQMPAFTVPMNAHVTAITGMIHSRDTSLWKTGMLATKGLENVAEEGNNTKMNLELDAIIAANKALSKFSITAPPITGSVSFMLNLNTDYSYVSFASMIAPSPDWFLGVHDLTLFRNNKWENEFTIDLAIYDSGTEEGDVFGYDNPETLPQQNITFLTASKARVLANGSGMLLPVGRIQFIKQ